MQADKLGRALKEKGVCLVELDAVSAFAVEELQGGAETFFARDAASKAACTGYVVGTGKQMYHHSPTTEQPRELEDRLVTAHSALQGVARVLLQSLCRSQVRRCGCCMCTLHRAREWASLKGGGLGCRC